MQNKITLNNLRDILADGYSIICSYNYYYSTHCEVITFVAQNILFGNSAFAEIQIGREQVTPTSEGIIVDLTNSMPYPVFEAWGDYQKNYLRLNGKD